MILAFAVAVMMGQEPQPEAAPAAEPAPAPTPAPAPAPKPAAVEPKTLNPDQIGRQVEKLRKLPPEEAAKAAEDLARKLPQLTPEEAKRIAEKSAASSAAVPEVRDYANLPEAEQVKYSAREFFTQLIAGDARNITNSCGFPFQLEERRLQTPDELFQEWLKNLRAKRTDLLTLYDIEVLSPADMEKKYGKPPARLSNLPWKAAKTYVAVANLSGHAAVAVFRQQGLGWAVVGYAD